MRAESLVWTRISNKTVGENVFELIMRNTKSMESADLIVCNSSHELEPGALKLAPQIIPIGRVLATDGNGDPLGSFLKIDNRPIR